SADDHQRDPRHLPHRGRADAAANIQAEGFGSGRGGSIRARADHHALEAERVDAARARSAAAVDRSPEGEADSAEPVEQRAQVHPPWLDHDCRAAPAEGAHRGHFRDRHRHRDRAGRSGEDLRGLPAARQLADSRVRRNRPGPVDLPPARPDARRPNRGRVVPRQGIHVHSDAPHQRTQMTTKNQRPRVLLVDDYPDARQMYSEYLEFWGFEVVEAGNGMEALERAAEAAPDIILMDLSLPVMDGWEATRRLKADKRTASIPVVALTGHALAGVSEDARR